MKTLLVEMEHKGKTLAFTIKERKLIVLFPTGKRSEIVRAELKTNTQSSVQIRGGKTKADLFAGCGRMN